MYKLVKRVAEKATKSTPSPWKKQVRPHTLRPSTAVHLLQVGVDINTIRSWLGHVSLETTNRYAEIDLETKARARQTCAESLSAPSAANCHHVWTPIHIADTPKRSGKRARSQPWATRLGPPAVD